MAMKAVAMKAALLLLGVFLALPAQTHLSVEQVVSFVRSSIKLKHPDKQVADYLRKVQLSERLEEEAVNNLQKLGAGPRTVEALRVLQESSKGLAAASTAQKAVPVPIPPPSESEQDAILRQVRAYALNYVRSLPDFMCTQVTRRFLDPSGLEFWTRQDVITARLSYVENREDYKVLLVNNRVTEASYDSLGGATSTGEFGSMLRELFEPGTQARFRWLRWATLRGRRAHVFSYWVDQPNSKWHISYQKTDEIVAGYRGLVYVDADSLSVVRITLEATGIPPAFPIQQASTVLDYDFTDIAGNQYLLPLKAVIRMREGRLLVKNEVEFRMYRKFAAEATITFDTPDPLPEDITQETPLP